jgi:uncharacterized damage-inducible protein DinB
MTAETEGLFAHMAWADAEMWKAIAASAAAEDARTLELATHIHMVQWAYLEVWRHGPLTFRGVSDFTGVRDIARWGQEYHDEAKRWLSGSEAADMTRRIEFPWAADLVRQFGAVHHPTLAETLQQVCMHSHYHRAQINTRIRDAGGSPPLVDYVAWIWRGRLPPEWP